VLKDVFETRIKPYLAFAMLGNQENKALEKSPSRRTHFAQTASPGCFLAVVF